MSNYDKPSTPSLQKKHLRVFPYTNNYINTPEEDLAALDKMTEHAEEIDFKTFKKKADWKSLAVSLGYGLSPEDQLRIDTDYHVRFYKSKFAKRPCVYLVWSGIEYYFVKPTAGELSAGHIAIPISKGR